MLVCQEALVTKDKCLILLLFTKWFSKQLSPKKSFLSVCAHGFLKTFCTLFLLYFCTGTLHFNFLTLFLYGRAGVLHCCAWSFISCDQQRLLSSWGAQASVSVVASRVVETGSRCTDFSSWGSQAGGLVVLGIWA